MSRGVIIEAGDDSDPLGKPDAVTKVDTDFDRRSFGGVPFLPMTAIVDASAL